MFTDVSSKFEAFVEDVSDPLTRPYPREIFLSSFAVYADYDVY